MSVPTTFEMIQPGASITVTVNHTAGGTQILSGALGSAGTFPFQVGGSFPMTSSTPLGSYTGTFVVAVNYN